jgi:thymidylate synthase (FAD)
MENIIDDKGFVELVDSMGDDLRVVNAARVSFNSESEEFSKKDETLIAYLLQNGHTSPLEHVIFTFLVKVPLFIRSQWMRHRTWSFNEISRRYTSDEMDFYIPKSFRKQSDDNKQASTEETIDNVVMFGDLIPVEEFMKEHSGYCENLYNMLIEQGVSREQARMILPQNMYTKYYATVDLHNLLHFLNIRNHPHAQFEMREYAKRILSIVTGIVPKTIQAWKNNILTKEK